MAPRRKAPAQVAPTTIEAATALLADYMDVQLGIQELRLDADASIAAIQAERDRMTAPMEQRAKAMFLQLRAWWGVAGPALTEGKRKSVELAGCMIGERTTPPSLKMPGKMAEAVALLEAAGWTELLRTKVEVDKPAVLKELGDDGAGELLRALGFEPRQKEEFFIDRAAPKAAAVEEVELPEAAE